MYETKLFEDVEKQIDELCNLIQQVGASLQKIPLDQGSSPSFIGVDQIVNQLARLKTEICVLEEKRKNLEALSQTGRFINSTLDLDEILQKVMDMIIRLLGAERGFLMLTDETGEFNMRVARNFEQETLEPSDAAISRTVIHRVLNEGLPVLTTNAQEDPRFTSQESIIAYNLRSILCVPLRVKEVTIGVIYADNRTRSGMFRENVLEMMYAFCDQAAIAIENARLFESVCKTLAEMTELKDLMNGIFESITSGVMTTDKEYRILLSNRAMRTIFNRSAQEIIGNDLTKDLPPLSSAIASQLQHVIDSDQPIIGLDINVVLPNRGSVDLRINLSPRKDANGQIQGVALVIDDLTEKKHLEAQRRLFERMVSPAVIRTIDADELPLGGKRSVITTLFADIRGFTGFSEDLPPEELVSILNCYLATAAEAVLFEDGTIDKFLGDAVMAWFNAPVAQPDHTLRAVRSALAIRSDLQSLYMELPEKYHLSFGVGIHVGEAVLGLVGTDLRLDYTAIGDSVNTAKRIQENAAAGQILISHEALQNVADIVIVEPVESIIAKGKHKPLQVYQVYRLK